MKKKHARRDSKTCCCCCCCCRFCCGAPTTDERIHAPVLHDASQIAYCRCWGRASLPPITRNVPVFGTELTRGTCFGQFVFLNMMMFIRYARYADLVFYFSSDIPRMRFVSVVVCIIVWFYFITFSSWGNLPLLQSYWSLSCDNGLQFSDEFMWEQLRTVRMIWYSSIGFAARYATYQV